MKQFDEVEQISILRHDLFGMGKKQMEDLLDSDEVRVCFGSDIPISAYPFILKAQGMIPDIFMQYRKHAELAGPNMWTLYQRDITEEQHEKTKEGNVETCEIASSGEVTPKQVVICQGNHGVDELRLFMLENNKAMLEEYKFEDTRRYKDLQRQEEIILDRLRQHYNKPSIEGLCDSIESLEKELGLDTLEF